MKYNAKYGKFLSALGKKTGKTVMCEAAHEAYKACCEASSLPGASAITLDSDPNYTVSLVTDSLDTPITFNVNAYDGSDAIERAVSELKDHNMPGYVETDEPEFPDDYIEVSGGYIRVDHVTVNKYEGDPIWAGMVPEFMLSYFVNADASGLSDADEAETKDFEAELLNDGVDVTSISPAEGPDGEFWSKDNDNYRGPESVLCTARKK